MSVEVGLSTPSSTASLSQSRALKDVFDHLHASKNGVFLLDGGTGEELFKSIPDDRKIWSAIALVNPKYHDCLQGVHRSFLNGGCNAITTNSYGVVPGVGFDNQEITKYVDLAGQIARRACQSHSTDAFVFGSLGPLIESYRPDKIMEHDDGVVCYERACMALAPHVDAFLAETMSCVEESLQVVEAVGKVSKLHEQMSRPIFISFTLSPHGTLRNSVCVTNGIRTLLEGVKTLGNDVVLLGVLFNCCEPESLTLALASITSDSELLRMMEDSKIVLGAYANRLTQVDPLWSLSESVAPQPLRTDIGVDQYWEDFVRVWIDDFGVKIVGGCCGITPEHISCIRKNLDIQKQGKQYSG
jgi:S-methylmethionine-dependent homocysteine/selenocysteine methylase